MAVRARTTARVCRLLSLAVPLLAVAYLLAVATRGSAGLVPWMDVGLGNGAIVLSAALCLARAWLLPQDRWAWLLIGLAPLMYVAGNLYYYLAMFDLADPPYPSWSDAMWLSVYPCFAVGLILLVRGTFRGRHAGLWLDGLTSGLGAAALVGVLVLRPVLSVVDGQLALVITNLAYPVLDLVLLCALVLVFNLLGWRVTRAWWLLGWTVVALLVADSVYLLQVANGTYRDGGVLDAGWSLAFAGLAPAAWARSASTRLLVQTRAGIVAPTVLSAASTAILFSGAVRTLPVVVAMFSLGAVLVATLRLMLSVVETRRLMRAQAEARTDELTGLPNRRHFLEELRTRLVAGEPLTVMLLDLDGFKKVNDTLGHSVGDTLLQVVGERIRRGFRSDQVLVARLGGDEFAAVVDGSDRARAGEVAERLRELIREPVQLAGVSLAVGASVGAALAPEHGSTHDVLLSRADAAMYEAKRARTGSAMFSVERDSRNVDQLSLLAELREAVTQGELELLYQPVYSVPDGRATSVEALVRWRHPSRGVLSPADFLPLAVEAGLTREITDVVLHAACRQASLWLAAGCAVPVAVNLFPADLTDPGLVRRVHDACAGAGVPAELLSLELTESATAAAMESALPALEQLRAAGHRLLLDDFGTGHSSLAYLRDLPIDVVKLDRSFLTRLDDVAGRAIVLAAVQLAHVLGMTITAEGIETEAMWSVVEELGCDTAQGFLMQRPATGEQIDAVLGLRWGAGAVA